MYKKHYSRFLEAEPDRLHFAAHSHHLWPDVTREAQLAYWDDTARDVDGKWDRVLGEVIPRAQRHVARVLSTSHPEDIAFAPNTHELVARLLSSFDWSAPLEVLTTDSEFWSFRRQIDRLEELETVKVTRVPALPFESFEERFRREASSGEYDLVFFSHVLFDSGYVFSDLEGIVDAVATDRTTVAVDGYHGFSALPTSLARIEDRVFYLAGGYKYGQSGEGVAFMHVPHGCQLRPMNTGWFASFDTLEDDPGGAVAYRDDAFRFWGATFDPSGLYRFNAVQDFLIAEGLDVETVHDYVLSLEDYFLAGMGNLSSSLIDTETRLLPSVASDRAHFICYWHPDATRVVRTLKDKKVIVDARGPHLRFGFGLYQDERDIDRLLPRLR